MPEISDKIMDSKVGWRRNYRAVAITAFVGILLFSTGCLVDSNDGTSPGFQIDTPMVFDMTGRWEVNLDQDTSFIYETRFGRSVATEIYKDSTQRIERTRFLITANKADNNRLELALSADITGSIQEGGSYPIRTNISAEDRRRIINEHQAIVQLSINYSRVVDFREENEERLFLRFMANNGNMEITRFDNNHFKARIGFSANLTGGQEIEYINSDSLILTEFEPDTNAVQIENLIDLPVGRTDNQ